MENTFLSYPRLFLIVSNRHFLIIFKQDVISFDEILFINYNNDDDRNLNLDLDIEDTLSVDAQMKVKQIYIESYLTPKNLTNVRNYCLPEMNIQLKKINNFIFTRDVCHFSKRLS